jgi:uncharacterized membrane protein HdeD (DUF308 family)
MTRLSLDTRPCYEAPMSHLVDVILCACLAAIAWGGGAIPPPLAVTLIAWGLLTIALSARGRASPPGPIALAVGLIGAHAAAAGAIPGDPAWPLSSGAASVAATVLLTTVALVSAPLRRFAHGELGLAALLALVVLAATLLALGPLGFAQDGEEQWRPLLAGVCGLLQGFSVAALCGASPRRRGLLCGTALCAAALVALLAPTQPPPLHPPARALFVLP